MLACLLLAISTKAAFPSFELPGFIGLGAPATINGELYLDNTATLNRMVIATPFDIQDLTTEQDAVISDSAGLAAFTPDQKATANQTIRLASGTTANRVPEPGAMILTGFAALLFHVARRRLTA